MYSCNFLPTFRDNLSVLSSKTLIFLDFLTLEDGINRFLETSVRITTIRCIISQKCADLIYSPRKPEVIQVASILLKVIQLLLISSSPSSLPFFPSFNNVF
jgi:hypothetical protein